MYQMLILIQLSRVFASENKCGSEFWQALQQFMSDAKLDVLSINKSPSPLGQSVHQLTAVKSHHGIGPVCRYWQSSQDSSR